MIEGFNDLMTSVDVLNTIQGGVSEPFVSFREQSNGREIRVRVPGIIKEAMQAEINNDELYVYYLIPVSSSGKLIHLPQVVYRQKIPYFIEINGIKATYEENELVVRLPFNELSNGYNRKIQIGKD
jgi:HSP20 family molecular chaperone IbpA